MTAERPLIGCEWHDGADIDACGCPALDSPGAIAYRGLLVKARAEIARLTAELAASRAVIDRVATIADEAFGPFPVQSVEESLTAIEGGIAAMTRATPAAPSTVGGLLAAAPVGSIVEFFDSTRPCWYQTRIADTGFVEIRSYRRHAWIQWRPDCDISGDIRTPGRLVAETDADLPPREQRGPLPKGG